MDPELLPGSGTRKIQSWIRIRNKSCRIRNAAKRPFLFSEKMHEKLWRVRGQRIVHSISVFYVILSYKKNVEFRYRVPSEL